MNVSEYLNDLWHNNDLFDDFLKNERNLNQNFFFDGHFIWNPLNLLNNLHYFFDMVYILNDFFHLFHDGDFFDNPFDFYHLGSHISDSNDLLFFYFYFSNFFNNLWYFDNFLYKSLNVLVYLDYLRNNSFYFDDFRDFNEFLNNFLHLINSGNGSGPLNDFFDDLLGSDDFLNF